MERIEDYFRRMTGFEPTELQIDLLNCLCDDTVEKLILLGGRGFSKSLCCTVFVLYRAELSLENDKPIKLMLASPQDSIYKYVNQYFSNSPKLVENLMKKGIYTVVPIEGFQLKNGTECFTKHATNKVRSSRADLLVMDEAADISAAIIKSANACLTGAEPNRIILVSTPHKTGYFTDIIDNSELGGWTVKHYSSLEAPWMLKTIERAKSMGYTPEEFCIEFEARLPTKEERGYFRRYVDDAMKETELQREGGPKSIVEFGLDFGFAAPTVLTGTEKNGVLRKALVIQAWRNQTIEEIAPEIGRIVSLWNGSLMKADSKPPEYRNKIESYLRCPVIYLDMQTHKAPAYGQLRKRFEDGQITIPKVFKDLERQLRKYVYETGVKGKGDDDLVDSLVMSCYDMPLDLYRLNWGKQSHGCVSGFRDKRGNKIDTRRRF